MMELVYVPYREYTEAVHRSHLETARRIHQIRSCRTVQHGGIWDRLISILIRLQTTQEQPEEPMSPRLRELKQIRQY